jgi:hypothetical protein
MKKFLVVFCSVTFVAILTIFTYNRDKGPARQSDGIAELPQPGQDSVLKRGKQLVDQMHYSEQDLKAIAAFLNNN